MLSKLRTYFFAGILVTMPVAVTFAIAWWFIDWIDSKILPLIPKHYNPVLLIEKYFNIDWGLPGFGLLLLITLLTLAGALTTNYIGRWWLNLGDRLINQLPVVRVIYTTIKQILETVMCDQRNAFQRVVLIEYPRKGLQVLAFVTRESSGIKEMPEDTLAVFVPTTPNPTSGFVIYVPRKNTIPITLPVEDAIKLVISIGIISSKEVKKAV